MHIVIKCIVHVYQRCICRPEYLSAMVASSVHLCSKLSSKLNSCEENHIKLLQTAFSCALCAIEKAHSLYTDEHGKVERDSALGMLRKNLNDWITNSAVIGGSVFGRSSHSHLLRNYTSWKGKEELKVNDGISVSTKLYL